MDTVHFPCAQWKVPRLTRRELVFVLYSSNNLSALLAPCMFSFHCSDNPVRILFAGQRQPCPPPPPPPCTPNCLSYSYSACPLLSVVLTTRVCGAPRLRAAT